MARKKNTDPLSDEELFAQSDEELFAQFEIIEARIRDGIPSSRKIVVADIEETLRSIRDLREFGKGNPGNDEAERVLRKQLSDKTRFLEELRDIEHGKPAQSHALNGKSYKTSLGRNIDRFRQECGLSYNALEDATGISKKLIIGHVKGKNAHPQNLKIYADVFTKQLGRPVTVADLLEK